MKVAESEAPGPDPWPDHSDMMPSHYSKYSFPLPHDTCLHACHFRSLTYLFSPPVVQILQVIQVAYQLASLSSSLSAASPFSVPASTATIFAERYPGTASLCLINIQPPIYGWIHSDPHMKLQLSRMMCLFFRPVRGVRRGAPTPPIYQPITISGTLPSRILIHFSTFGQVFVPEEWDVDGQESIPFCTIMVAVLAATRRTGVTRLIALSTVSTKDEVNDKRSVVYAAMVAAVALGARSAYKDTIAVGEVIRAREDVCLAIIRVTVLKNDENRVVWVRYIGNVGAGVA